MLGIAAVCLNRAIELLGLAQRLGIAGRAVVFDQRLDHNGLAVQEFAIVEHLAHPIGGPEVAAVGPVAEMFLQEPVAIPGSAEIVALGIAYPEPVGVREPPDQARLRDHQLLRRNLGLERVAAQVPVDRVVVPVGHDLIGQLPPPGLRLLGKSSRLVLGQVGAGRLGPGGRGPEDRDQEGRGRQTGDRSAHSPGRRRVWVGDGYGMRHGLGSRHG